LICPEGCGGEAVWAGERLDILAPLNLLQLINHMKGTQVLSRPSARQRSDVDVFVGPDMALVRGQETARRALEITAAGGHNLLMSGPPGSGKSLLASCLPGILPPLSAQEALETSMVHSLAGMLPEDGLLTRRPFRDPHHSASMPALIGGGAKAKPGEISLAHNGVLFLDELPEFARATLESLRQPLESGKALVARVNHHVQYPARFQLIAAMNPCRCGYLGDVSRECTRAPKCAVDYQAKISGPLLDRFDLQVDVQPVAIRDLQDSAQAGESSRSVAARVAKARNLQAQRGHGLNAVLSGAVLDEVVNPSAEAKTLLGQAAEKLKLSARGYHRLLRTARTISDLAGEAGPVEVPYMAEALSYRQNWT
jgi:magnesium chelatase family protein